MATASGRLLRRGGGPHRGPHSHRVALAVVGQGVPNVDLGAEEALPAAVTAVGDGDGVDGVPATQVYTPPRLQLHLGVGTGAALPVGIAVPVHGVGGQADGVQCG